jgi:hypothetical protein
MPRPKNQRDEFAEHYVAAIFADKGWSIYFPRKDKGFDFVVSKQTEAGVCLRPVQVKGKYPETITSEQKTYGYRGKLTALHEEMVLAIPLFTAHERLEHPDCIAFMPFHEIKKKEKDGTFYCLPAKLEKGKVSPKQKFKKYFDGDGLKLVETEDFSQQRP